MNCKNCGTLLNPTDKFCLNCGTPVEAAPVSPVPVAPAVPEVKVAENMATGLPVGQPVPPMAAPNPATPVAPINATPVVPPVAPTMPGVIPNQPMAPSMPGVMPMQPASKNNKKLFIIIGVIIAITVAIVVALIFFLGGDDSSNSTNDTGKGDNTQEEEKPTPEAKKETSAVQFGNFTFNIPTDYVVNVKDEYVSFYNDKYYMEMAPYEGYTLALTQTSDIETTLTSMGVTNINVEEKTSNNKKYIVATGVYSGVEAAFVFSKSTTTYYISGFAYQFDYGFEDEIVDELINIMSETEYSSTSNMDNTITVGKVPAIK